MILNFAVMKKLFLSILMFMLFAANIYGQYSSVLAQGNWGKIVHDRDSMWIANWMDVLTQKRKYVWLADTAGIKQERDQAKYDKAKKLAREIENVKAQIYKKKI